MERAKPHWLDGGRYEFEQGVRVLVSFLPLRASTEILWQPPQHEMPVRSNFAPNESIAEALQRRNPFHSSSSTLGSFFPHIDYQPGGLASVNSICVDSRPVRSFADAVSLDSSVGVPSSFSLSSQSLFSLSPLSSIASLNDLEEDADSRPVHSFADAGSTDSLIALPSSFSLSSSPSLFSLSPLSSLASLSDSEGDAEPSTKEEVPHCSVNTEAHNTPTSTSRKRRRKNNEREAERRVKRQKANPRKRKPNKKKMAFIRRVKEAGERAVHTNKEYQSLNRSKKFIAPGSINKAGSFADKEGTSNKQDESFDRFRRPSNEGVFTLSDLKSQGFEVIEWDGM